MKEVLLRRKLVDALLYTDNEVINIEVNSSFNNIIRTRNVAYIMNAYSRYYLKGKKYDDGIETGNKGLAKTNNTFIS